MENIILITLITGTIAVVLNLILKGFDVPPIIGYIFTGAIMGTFLSVSGTTASTLEHIAEFGIVFLMFTIGLELKLENLIDMRKQVFTYGTLQVLGVMGVFTFIAYFAFNLDIKASLVIGGALSLSSTAIVLKTLNETGDIHRPYGRYSVGILIFQDIAVIPILIMITLFTNQDASINDMIIDTLISVTIVLATLYFMGKFVLEALLTYVIDSKTEELFIISVILIVLSSALLSHEMEQGQLLFGICILFQQLTYQQ